MSALFITATGTNVGKTLVTAALTHQVKASKKNAMAIKPIISGFIAGATSDTTILADCMGLGHGPDAINRISPWRYKAPLAPNIAAVREGREIPFKDLIAFCQKNVKENDNTFIEGIGGTHVPLAKGILVVDWIKALKIPALLVTGSYVGALSHTLITLRALKAEKIPVAGIVVSESEDVPMALADTVTALWDQSPGTKIYSIKRITEQPVWKHVPDLREILE